MPTTLPIYVQRHWAKSDREELDQVHLLEHHLADVGACFEALLAVPTIHRRLAHSGDREILDDATTARLCVFAALHDIGKLNVGFQAQIWRNSDLPQGVRRPNRAGHTLDLTPILSGADTTTGSWFFDALGWNDFLTWDEQGGETACGILVATFSHHGRPLQLSGPEDSGKRKSEREAAPKSARLGGLG